MFFLALIGIPLGITKCQKTDEVVYTNIFLNEEFSLHDDNYLAVVNRAWSSDLVETIDNKGNKNQLNGHYICVDFSISQKDDSVLKGHKFDDNDFKLKDHTGIHVPTKDIARMLGWNMFDFKWDQANNGFVVSSADFETKKSIKDYSYIDKEINAGEQLDFVIFFEMPSKFTVENDLMVLEVDFYTSINNSKKRMGEDIILLPRPINLQKE